MKLGVISDTHGDVRLTQRALDILDAHQVDLVLHCGDVGYEVVPLFDGRRLHLVAGNTDDLEGLHEVIIDPLHTFHGQIGELEFEGCRIAFLHGHDVALLRHTIQSGRWNIVCHGHTHAASETRDGATLVINPGAVSRTAFPSVALIELPSMEVTELPL